MSITVEIGSSGIAASVSTKQIVLASELQPAWDGSNDTEKNTFVDANDDEIITFLDISTEAEKMLARYTTLGVTLTGTERTAMVAYVDAEVASGNHQKKDYEIIFPLSGVNSLIDYIGGKIATPINAPTFDIKGVNLNAATQYVSSNFITSINGVNYKLDDALAGGFAISDTRSGNNRELGGGDNFSTLANLTVTVTSANKIRAVINTLTQSSLSAKTISNSLYLNIRTSSNSQNTVFDGVLGSAGSVSSTGLPDLNVGIGARVRNSDVIFHWGGIIASFIFGGAIGFNHPDYNTNLRTLFTSLGTLP